MPYFTAPKPLLVFTLGALGDATLASYCSALGAAALSALVYLVCRDNFGSPTAVLTSIVFLLDPSKTALAMKSGAEFTSMGGVPAIGAGGGHALRALAATHRSAIPLHAARDGAPLEPDWIVDIPGIYTSDRAREWMAALLRQRHYAVALQAAQAALLGPPRTSHRPTPAAIERRCTP
jgi:hypothetical protein